MRIGIVTLPLHTNYGGVLQAYALQQVLYGLGHDAVLIQPLEVVSIPRGLRALVKYSRRIFKKKLLGKALETRIEKRICDELPIVGRNVSEFISGKMAVERYGRMQDVNTDSFDAFVVGSDQIWRPVYSHRLSDAFLGFTKGHNVRRIAYAASFGVDYQEYSKTQRRKCGQLLSAFDAISVREQSGVTLCRDMFGIDALHMPDPVMLLTADHYSGIADKSATPTVFAYILDKSPDVLSVADRIAVEYFSSPVFLFNSVEPRGKGPVESRVQPSVEKWLGGIETAKCVITDSFHACVFSLLFHKDFFVIVNSGRGLSRIESLLSWFGFQDRLVVPENGKLAGLPVIADVDWDAVDKKLESLRKMGMDFLKEALR